MPRRKPHPDQQRLPLEVNWRERFATLEAIDWRRSGLTQRRWVNVRRLLREVHNLDRERGCFASASYLAKACEFSRRTLFRARDDALELGVLSIEHRARQTGNGGRDTNVWRVVWAVVVSMDYSREVECHSAQVECQNASVECHSGTAINRKSSELSSLSRDGSRATSFELLDDRQLELARRLGNEILQAVGQPEGDRNRETAAKAATLAVTRFGEAWLHSTLEAVRHCQKPRKSRWGYWWRCLETETAERCDCDLRRELARTQVDPRLTTKRTEHAVA